LRPSKKFISDVYGVRGGGGGGCLWAYLFY